MGISVPNDAQVGRGLLCRRIWRRGQRHIVMAQPDPADGGSLITSQFFGTDNDYACFEQRS